MLLVVWDDWGLRGLKGLTSGRKGEGVRVSDYFCLTLLRVDLL